MYNICMTKKTVTFVHNNCTYLAVVVPESKNSIADNQKYLKSNAPVIKDKEL